MSKHKWHTPHMWLHDYLSGLDGESALRQEAAFLASLIDPDTIQDMYQDQMEEDGYFKEMNDDN